MLLSVVGFQFQTPVNHTVQAVTWAGWVSGVHIADEPYSAEKVVFVDEVLQRMKRWFLSVKMADR